MAEELSLPIERDIFLSKQVNQDSMNEIVKKIIHINESDKHNKKLYKLHGIKYKRKPIRLFIDSYGGTVYQCLGLIGVMEKSKTPVHTYVTGCAMSCGFLILINGHKRFAYKYATPLYHQVSGGLWGKLKDMEEDIDETKRLQKVIEEMTLRRTKITPEILKEKYEKKQDWYLNAQEGLEWGVVDEIV
jgi:ATP-dependent Clp protease protease subunit